MDSKTQALHREIATRCNDHGIISEWDGEYYIVEDNIPNKICCFSNKALTLLELQHDLRELWDDLNMSNYQWYKRDATSLFAAIDSFINQSIDSNINYLNSLRNQ